MLTLSTLLMAALVSPASAGTVFTSAGDETLLDLNGNWPRAYLDASTGGWDMFHAGGGDFKLTHADMTLTFDHTNDKDLTGRTDLKDNDIHPCPDGTWLQVSTADSVPDSHDSWFAWRYDSSFNINATTTIAYGDTSGADYVDTPGVCGDTFQGGAYFFNSDGGDTASSTGDVPSVFTDINSAAAATAYHNLDGAPTAIGSSMFEDNDHTLYFCGFTAQNPQSLIVGHFDSSYNRLDANLIPVTTSPMEAYFAQSSLRVGQYYIVAHMMRDSSLSWSQQNGDIYLSAFDSHWGLVDQIQLSHNVAPDGGVQPFVINAKDGTLLAMYSKDLKNYAFIVTLDSSVDWGASGDTDTDTDTDSDTDTDTDTDTATNGDSDQGQNTGDTSSTPIKGSCGCASAPTGEGALGLLLGGLALAGARRSRAAKA